MDRYISRVILGMVRRKVSGFLTMKMDSYGIKASGAAVKGWVLGLRTLMMGSYISKANIATAIQRGLG